MRTKVFSVFIVLLVLLFAACEGPMGPAGPAGPEGPEGPEGPPGRDAEVDDLLEGATVAVLETNYSELRVFTSLQSAIDQASTGETVWAAPAEFDGDLVLDVPGLKVLGWQMGQSVQGGDRGSESVINGRVEFHADAIVFDGFTVVGPEGDDRAIAPRGSDSVVIRNNIITNSMRGVQGDWHGRPSDLTLEANRFETDYGLSGTEGMKDLLVVDNEFDTAEEAIGLGEGVLLVDANGDVLEPRDMVGWVEANNTFLAAGVANYIPDDWVFNLTRMNWDNELYPGETYLVGPGPHDVSSTTAINVDGVTLMGLNEGTPWDGVRDTETVIEGQLVIEAENVTLDGLYVDDSAGGGRAAIDVSFAHNPTVLNTIVEPGSNAAGIMNWNGISTSGTFTAEGNRVIDGAIGVWGPDIAEIVFNNNKVTGSEAEGLWTGPSTAGVVITMEDNLVENTGGESVKIEEEPASLNGSTPASQDGQAWADLVLPPVNDIEDVRLVWINIPSPDPVF